MFCYVTVLTMSVGASCDDDLPAANNEINTFIFTRKARHYIEYNGRYNLTKP